MDALIQLQGVDFTYPDGPQILKNLDLGVKAGEKLGLMGPTGCGKTTSLHLMVGLLKPQAGRILAFGKERKTEADFQAIRSQAGLVFQDSEDQLFCPTVIEDVAFGPLNLGKSPDEARQISLAALEQLGLVHLAERITYKLSYGQKRLVAIATILSMQPQVLLLDEPTNGLDPKTKEQLLELLQSLPQALVVVSHEEDFLSRLCQRQHSF